MTAWIFICIGCLNAAAAVIMGALGAHALKATIPESLTAVYQTAFQFHMLHSLGLIAVALILQQVKRSMLIELAGWMMIGGILLFSGSLYVLAVTQVRRLGLLTPVGGTAFIAAWLMVAAGVIKTAAFAKKP